MSITTIKVADRETITIGSESVSVVTASIQGLQGPQGPKGDTGDSGANTSDNNITTKGLYEMSHTIGTVGTPVDYVIGTGNNALSAGPITVEAGSSVTIPTGSTWVIA